MSFFRRFHGEAPPPEPPKSEQGQLLQILEKIKADSKIYPEILKQLADRNTDKFKSLQEAQGYLESATTDADALGVAKLIDHTLGGGTFRTLSFLDENQDSARSVYKLLEHNIKSTSFEKQVEKGHYLNLLETYGVSWDLEKVSRDSVQNFFDANGQTLNGVDIQTGVEEKMDATDKTKTKTGRVLIRAPQDYDWRELIHFGGTTKQDSEISVGGFGEGLKIAAFVLLKDQGAKQVRAASRDWEIDYYFSDVTSESYRKPVKGLHAKKRKRNEQTGNCLKIVFEGDDADKKVKVFENAKELFYSSENPDFQGASFSSKASGGFKILPPDLEGIWAENQKDHLYLAGQRTHYDSRDKWETVEDLNIWTWKKVQPKDRDRGMLTMWELRDNVLPMIVASMSLEDLRKSAYDFKPLWDQFSPPSPGDDLLEKIVDKLAQTNTILEFEKEYVADDLPWGPLWIKEALVSQGFKLCRPYMKKVGMRGVVEQFKEWQSHNRVEARPEEVKKIELLQKAARALGLPEDELKEAWIFSRKDEKSIFSGQYNDMFYWLSREDLTGTFFDSLNTYVHEAAHKKGPHENTEFEYGLERRKQKITQFILEHKNEWDEMENEWKSMAEK